MTNEQRAKLYITEAAENCLGSPFWGKRLDEAESRGRAEVQAQLDEAVGLLKCSNAALLISVAVFMKPLDTWHDEDGTPSVELLDARMCCIEVQRDIAAYDARAAAKKGTGT